MQRFTQQPLIKAAHTLRSVVLQQARIDVMRHAHVCPHMSIRQPGNAESPYICCMPVVELGQLPCNGDRVQNPFFLGIINIA